MADRDNAPDRPRRKPRAGRHGKGSAKARRSAARLAAVQALYQIELAQTEPEAVLGEFMQHRLGHEIDGETYVAAEPQLFADIVRGVAARLPELDAMVRGALDPQVHAERLEPLFRAVLRAGAFEIMAHAHVPPRIAISEYVDIAHAFFGGREPAIINAVLDRLARLLRPDELAATAPDRVAATR